TVNGSSSRSTAATNAGTRSIARPASWGRAGRRRGPPALEVDPLEAARMGGLERVPVRDGKAGRGDLAHPDRGYDGLCLGVHGQLREDVLDVGSQGVPAHAEYLGDPFRRRPLGHRLKDLQLARREALDATHQVAVHLRSLPHRLQGLVDL